MTVAACDRIEGDTTQLTEERRILPIPRYGNLQRLGKQLVKAGPSPLDGLLPLPAEPGWVFTGSLEEQIAMALGQQQWRLVSAITTRQQKFEARIVNDDLDARYLFSSARQAFQLAQSDSLKMQEIDWDIKALNIRISQLAGDLRRTPAQDDLLKSLGNDLFQLRREKVNTKAAIENRLSQASELYKMESKSAEISMAPEYRRVLQDTRAHAAEEEARFKAAATKALEGLAAAALKADNATAARQAYRAIMDFGGISPTAQAYIKDHPQ